MTTYPTDLSIKPDVKGFFDTATNTITSKHNLRKTTSKPTSARALVLRYMLTGKFESHCRQSD